MAPAATAASKPKTAAKSAKTVTADVDLVRSYLRDIGRVPLLTHEQEITLGRQVQELMDLESLESELESKSGEKPSRDQLAKASGLSSMQLKRKLQHGRRAKERMVAANLRLVVSVAKKYTKRNMELLDLPSKGDLLLMGQQGHSTDVTQIGTDQINVSRDGFCGLHSGFGLGSSGRSRSHGALL